MTRPRRDVTPASSSQRCLQRAPCFVPRQSEHWMDPEARVGCNVRRKSMRAAIYCRVSSAGQRENYSLGSQEDLCRRYAASQCWTVVHVESEQHSGADLHDREGLQRALTLIEDGGADILLALATDRLSREQLHIGVIL